MSLPIAARIIEFLGYAAAEREILFAKLQQRRPKVTPILWPK
jgi:hypothetical protein